MSLCIEVEEYGSLAEKGEVLLIVLSFSPWLFSARDGNAEKRVGSELYAEGDR